MRLQSSKVSSGTATTTWGGWGLTIGGVLWALGSAGPLFPHIVTVAIWHDIAGIITCAAGIILAIGIRGEPGIAGSSRVGAAAIIIFGLRSLAIVVASFIAGSTLGVNASAGVAGVISTVLTVIIAASTLTAGIAVSRAGILHGLGRWTLFALGCCYMIMVIFQFVSIPVVGTATGYLADVLVVLTGLSYVFHGHAAAIRARARTINEHW